MITVEQLAQIERILLDLYALNEGKQGVNIYLNGIAFVLEKSKLWSVFSHDHNRETEKTLREAYEAFARKPLDLPKVFVSEEGIRDYDRPLGVVWKSDDGSFYARLDKPYTNTSGKDFEQVFTSLRHALRWTHTVLKHER
jgi:hypothetical protein